MSAIAQATSPPGDQDPRDPAARAPGLDQHAARDLEQEVAEEKDPGAEPVLTRRPEREVVPHRQRGVADVHPIEIGDEVEQQQVGNDPQHVRLRTRAARASSPRTMFVAGRKPVRTLTPRSLDRVGTERPATRSARCGESREVAFPYGLAALGLGPLHAPSKASRATRVFLLLLQLGCWWRSRASARSWPSASACRRWSASSGRHRARAHPARPLRARGVRAGLPARRRAVPSARRVRQRGHGAARSCSPGSRPTCACSATSAARR